MKRAMPRAAALAAGAALLASCAVGAESQGGGGESGSADYPSGNIEIVVPYDAGGATDQLARLIAPAIEEALGEDASVIVLNEPGGAGTVGTTSLVNAEPDGYTLAITAPGPLTVQTHFGEATYTLDDVQPVARIATSPIVFAVRADAPWETLDDFIADAEADPGSIRYASTGAGNPANIAVEKFDMAAGIDTVQVPFASSSEAVTALLGDNVDAAAGSPSAFLASVEAGDLRILANLGEGSAEGYEDVPTLTDSGFDASTNIVTGLIAPAGTPDEIVTTVADAVETALADPEVADAIAATGVIPSFGDGATYGEDLQRDSEENHTVLLDLGLIE
ncbi:Tricarboxylate transport protein TctC [Actinomycetales bacterium JB111]|nr:Tricarboxylate transport protein TctC [Actinomycetales bacterium JB111]